MVSKIKKNKGFLPRTRGQNHLTFIDIYDIIRVNQKNSF